MANELVAFTFEQLYPVAADPAATALTQSVLTWEKNMDGKYLLSRELSDSERLFLSTRRTKLSEALISAPDKEVRKCVSRMMTGFLAGKDVSDDNAKAIVTQYIHVLKGLPFWAIERACQKFSRGEIAAIRDENVKLAFGPSTAQLYQIASGLCGEFYKELTDIVHALHGVVERRRTEEEEARVKEGFVDLTTTLRRVVDADKEQAEEERRQRDQFKVPDDDDLRRIYAKPKKKDETNASA